MWVVPGTDFNVLVNGYATLDSLFIIAPWVFMFLVPAITMRSFAEENKSGTIELLLTLPVSDMKIVLAKYLSGFLLVILSLLPTLTYYITVYRLANPTGNVDSSAIAGSYAGLLFLASAFVSIGVFSSALSNNQVVSFILAVVLSFFFHAGFDAISNAAGSGWISSLLSKPGMSLHYASISRGVIDTRDLVYFVSLTIFFMLLTKFIIGKRKW